MHFRQLIFVMGALTLAGCASAPPGTPGAGVGQSYTPIIDTQGVDMGRYQSDLAACRQYASSVDANRDQLNAAIGGALFSAAVMALAGGNNYQVQRSASVGGFVNMDRQGNRSLTKQEMILGNCLAARGYRVLDGSANVSFVQGAASVAPPSVPAPATTLVDTAAPVATAPVHSPAESRIVRLPSPVIPPPPKPTGVDSYAAERLSRQANCNATSLATLIGKGPGYESYSMQCTNGDMMMIRCEMGNCRELK